MSFKDQLESFKPVGEALDPYIKGREEYLNQYGRLASERDSWKKIAMYLVAIIAVMSIVTGYISTRSTFIPFMLTMDSQTGYIQPHGPITEAKYTPGEAEIVYFLADVLKKVRTVPLDPIAYRASWDAAGAFMSSKCNQKMSAIVTEEGQRGLLGKATVQPTILSVQPMSNANNTYVIRWTEEIYSLSGGSAKINNTFSGTFTISIKTPKNKQDFYTNPIGMVIEDFSWSKENSVTDRGGR